MKALVALPSGSHFKVFWFFIALNVFFWNFDLITCFCVTKAYPSLFEPANNFLQISIELGLDFVDVIVCAVEIIIYANLWFRDLYRLVTRHFLPFDKLVELGNSSCNSFWRKTILRLGSGRHQGNKPFRL